MAELADAQDLGRVTSVTEFPKRGDGWKFGSGWQQVPLLKVKQLMSL